MPGPEALLAATSGVGTVKSTVTAAKDLASATTAASIRSVIEVALHFESFRNIDLFHQGLYHLKTRLYKEGDAEERSTAVPCGYLASQPQASQQKPKPARPDHHHLIPAHIIEDQYTFSTRSFLIRYCEEEVELNDIGQFRIELTPEEVEKGASLLLEVDLMFADLTQHGGADRFGEQPDVDSTEFKSVSTQVLRLRGSHKGIHEFSPVVFDEFHFCVANIIVHSTLLDFRLRVRPALSLAECLHLGTNGTAGSSRESLLASADSFYKDHVEVLNESCARLEEWFKSVCQTCLTPSQREAFKDAIEIPSPIGVPVKSETTATLNGGGLAVPFRKRLEAALGQDVTDQSVAAFLAYDSNLAAARASDVWHKALNIMLHIWREITALLRITWEQRVAAQWGQSIVKETILTDIFVAPNNQALADRHSKKSEQLRLGVGVKLADDPVEDTLLMPKVDARPSIFEQRYWTDQSSSAPALPKFIPSAPKPYRGVHLFVLVHGFQGNSFDMRLMKNNVALLYPDAIFLCSTSNEENTEGDISDMGIRLAQEVVNYVCDWCPGSTLGRLSFMAHSMGGLIVRAALPLLHEYRNKMHTVITFSSSHLGLFQDKISLFNTGFWVLKQWRKSLFLQQVSMTDTTDPRESFLFKLSKSKGFEFFQNVVLVSCYDDQYGPFESARAEINSTWDGQSDKDIYREMVRNIWEPVDASRVLRFDINFHIPEKNLDAFIGRAAHIQFLECQAIMKMLIHNYGYLFR